MKRIPERYLNGILHKAAEICIEEAEWSKGLLAADSTGVEMDRYESAMIACKSAKRSIQLKYYVLPIPWID